MAAIVENMRASETVEPMGSTCERGVIAGWRINWSACLGGGAGNL